MSLWIYRRLQKDGRRPLYSVSVHPGVIIGGVGILFVMLLPLISALRELFR